MTKAIARESAGKLSLPKAATGIQGLDEITRGGFPRGRPTLICGSAGAGKTLLAMEFLVRGATEYNEPGVFMAFEETASELTQNVRSLGFDLDELVRRKKLAIDFVRIERSEIDETGDYDLEGLFIRLGAAIDAIGAKRVVLDTIENLFAGLQNQGILRAELRRLFRWLKDRGVTAVITAERGAPERENAFLPFGEHMRLHSPDFAQLDSPIGERRINNELCKRFVVDRLNLRSNERRRLANLRQQILHLSDAREVLRVRAVFG